MDEHAEDGMTPDEVRAQMDLPHLSAVPEPNEDYGWAMPVDYGILENMPPQGSRLGYHVLGATVKTILEALNADVPVEHRMSPGIVSQRIARWLRPNGMVVEVKVHSAGGAKGYQITERGQRMLAAGKEVTDV